VVHYGCLRFTTPWEVFVMDTMHYHGAGLLQHVPVLAHLTPAQIAAAAAVTAAAAATAGMWDKRRARRRAAC